MNTGTVVFDANFEFSDKTIGQKILVVLNDGTEGIFVVLKTTSQSKHKGVNNGCQTTDRYPNFFVAQGQCFLHKDTWIMLDQFFEFDCSDFMAKGLRTIGQLPVTIIKDLLDCAMNCDDITPTQENLLRQVRASLP